MIRWPFPPGAVAFMAEQLAMDPAQFADYARRQQTVYEHAWEIRAGRRPGRRPVRRGTSYGGRTRRRRGRRPAAGRRRPGRRR
ncbi:DUF4158 domain-containing protein [Nonomuraea africana]|uniref:DUF4158 domain-containing protein n=1 Tax=Nonomuraea africana TaxID=46171 RepID=UPI0033E6BF4F